jgi:hypothetical protein
VTQQLDFKCLEWLNEAGKEKEGYSAANSLPRPNILESVKCNSRDFGPTLAIRFKLPAPALSRTDELPLSRPSTSKVNCRGVSLPRHRTFFSLAKVQYTARLSHGHLLIPQSRQGNCFSDHLPVLLHGRSFARWSCEARVGR